MTNAILYSEINAVCVLFLVLICNKSQKAMYSQEQRNLFFKVAISNIVFLCLDMIWIFINNNVFVIAVFINWLLNGCYYICSGLLSFYWFQYSETVQESKLVREKRYRWIAFIPISILIILTFVSLKTGWLFYIDKQNIYHRGQAYVLQLLTSYGYVLFTALKAFYLSFHTDNYRRKSELRTLAAFVVPTLLAGSLQVAFPGFPILCLGNTFGILYVFMSLQEQLISLDALTRLNNRNQLFQYLSTKLHQPQERKALYLLIMDVDYFKSINDQYGHIAGDAALKIVADCLMKVCEKRNYFISRYGGDEFIAICELEPTDSIQSVCDDIHAELREADTPYPLSVSIGYARYSPDIKSQQEFIEKADQELYKVKKSRAPKQVIGIAK